MAGNERIEDLRHVIRDWLSSQQHLPKISDKKITVFLHSCHYKVENTKKTIEAHYRIKASTPEFFSHRDPSGTDIEEIQKVVELALLPKPTPKGNKIILGRLKSSDVTHLSWNSAIKLLFMVCDLCEVMEELIPGFLFVFDAKCFTLSHLTRMSFVTIKKYVAYTQDAMPICRKAIHVLNVGTVVPQLLNLGRPFVRAEHFKTIMVYDGVPEKFYAHVPRECLPSDLGGTQKSMSELAADTIALMQKHSSWYIEEKDLKLDMSVCDKYKENNVQDTEGSFRDLSID